MNKLDAVVDTSIAVPLLVISHEAHRFVVQAVGKLRLALAAHSLAETYSVLTRLPGDARLDLADAASLLDRNFTAVLAPKAASLTAVHSLCAELGIGGGATYDALVALAARDHRLRLLTRDRRAQATYQQLGVDYQLVER